MRSVPESKSLLKPTKPGIKNSAFDAWLNRLFITAITAKMVITAKNVSIKLIGWASLKLTNISCLGMISKKIKMLTKKKLAK